MKVLLSTRHVPFPYLRQTPAGDGVWENLKFFLNESESEADWLVVYDEPIEGFRTSIPRERRILFITEPPELKHYHASYLNQFQAIASAYRPAGFKGRLLPLQQPALPWFYGVNLWSADHPEMVSKALNWEGLMLGKDKKPKEISVVCSKKAFSPQHRQRLIFVEYLQKRLGNRLDVFGRGFNEVADKADAIAPYRYHIVLENNVVEHFWTEKLADAWLGDSYPIYAGCRNVTEYFDPVGFSQIDIHDPEQAADKIETLLSSNAWAKNRDTIRANRHKLMTRYNLFAVIQNIIEQTGGADFKTRRLDVSEDVGLTPMMKWVNKFHRIPRRLRRAFMKLKGQNHLKA